MLSGKTIILCTVILFCFSQTNYSQNIRISLDSLTSLDDSGFHITALSGKAKRKLVLPAIDTAGVKFMTLFYCRSGKGNENIDVMIQQKEDFDLLWIDKNNNEDLTDDGTPVKFLLMQNEVSFDIIPVDDANQKTKLFISRKPSAAKEDLERYIDKEGNLNPKFYEFIKNISDNFTSDGKKRSFYFDGRITVRKGMGQFNNKKYLIGLFDYSNNGIFNDSDDVVIIDKNNNNKITYSGSVSGEDEILKLDEIFSLEGTNFKIAGVDKYGKWIEFAPTKESPNFSYLKYTEQRMENSKNSAYEFQLDEKFWDNTFTTIDGKKFRTDIYKGKFLLINFWGEWCKPCVAEIPELVSAYTSFSRDKLEIIGFLNVSNADIAKKLIKEKQMTWNNVVAAKETLTQFKIIGFPTNILIFPDGKTGIKCGLITADLFRNYIK